MPIFKIARYEIRPEARAQVERAIDEFAAYVRAELPDSTWTTYRETHDRNRYISIITAETAAADERHRTAAGTVRFVEALYPNVVGNVEFTDYELAADSRAP
jgi:quinol monooxygenase YgiN